MDAARTDGNGPFMAKVHCRCRRLVVPYSVCDFRTAAGFIGRCAFKSDRCGVAATYIDATSGAFLVARLRLHRRVSPPPSKRGVVGFNFGMICCGTISLKCRTVGLIRATGLKALGTFTAFGLCSRFRWASVVGRAFSR